MTEEKNIYDVVVIGAGMSGLAASIRLSMYDKKVLLLEKHSIPGGLNSYYQRGKILFDVGLHALTNFSIKSEKKKPLNKLLKQLRIDYDQLKLSEQKFSTIKYKSKSLKFTNDINVFLTEIEEKFPLQIENFKNFLEFLKSYNETSLENKYLLAKKELKSFFNDDEFIDMLMCPLLIYGSAWENDMEFSQFVIMFKSIYLEGFSRPSGGVRTIINLLINRLKETNCEVLYKKEVTSISKVNDYFLITLKNNEVIYSKQILSSMGHPETFRLIKDSDVKAPAIGNLSFCEVILGIKKGIPLSEATIVFYNDGDRYNYERSKDYFDNCSAVICFPDNFETNEKNDFTTVRLTFIANFKLWNELLAESKELYNLKKKEVIEAALHILNKEFDFSKREEIIFSDVFTPTTITKFTSRLSGAVYGSPDKIKNGKTSIPGLYLIGTDQGFLGIVGSMLSGISIANLYCLMGEPT